jgi:uncharacterized protein YjbJ (UPF0337 family)
MDTSARRQSIPEESTMNDDRISGNWKQFKGKVKEKWGKLTDDDMDVAEGKRDQLVGRIQERYGYEKDQAEKELKDWEDSNQYRW